MNESTQHSSVALLGAVLLPLLIPAAITVLATAVARYLVRGRRWDYVVVAFSVPLALTAAIWLVRGLPHWPPSDTLDLMPLALLCAVVVGALLDTYPWLARKVTHFVAAFLVTTLASYLLFGPWIDVYGRLPAYGRFAAAGALGAILMLLLRLAVSPTTRGSLFGGIAGASSFAGLIVAFAGSSLLGQVFGALAVSAGILALAYLTILRSMRLGFASVMASVVAYLGLWGYSLAFVVEDVRPFVLLGLAPFGALLGRFFKRPVLAFVVSVCSAVVLSALAAAWSYMEAHGASAAGPYSY